jgi:hypothetical protein
MKEFEFLLFCNWILRKQDLQCFKYFIKVKFEIHQIYVDNIIKQRVGIVKIKPHHFEENFALDGYLIQIN